MKRIYFVFLGCLVLTACDTYKDKLYKFEYEQCMSEMDERQKNCFPSIINEMNGEPVECRKWLQGEPRDKCLDEFVMKKYGVTYNAYKSRVCNDWTALQMTQEEFCEKSAYAATKNFTEEQARFKLKHMK